GRAPPDGRVYRVLVPERGGRDGGAPRSGPEPDRVVPGEARGVALPGGGGGAVTPVRPGRAPALRAVQHHPADGSPRERRPGTPPGRSRRPPQRPGRAHTRRHTGARSEEHTSELQSRF